LLPPIGAPVGVACKDDGGCIPREEDADDADADEEVLTPLL